MWYGFVVYRFDPPSYAASWYGAVVWFCFPLIINVVKHIFCCMLCFAFFSGASVHLTALGILVWWRW